MQCRRPFGGWPGIRRPCGRRDGAGQLPGTEHGAANRRHGAWCRPTGRHKTAWQRPGSKPAAALLPARPAWRRRPVRCLLWQARCGAGLKPRRGISGTNPRTKRTREPPRRRRSENASRVPGAGTDHPQNAPPRTSRTPPGFVWCSLSFSTFPLLSARTPSAPARTPPPPARATLSSACSLSGIACIPP